MSTFDLAAHELAGRVRQLLADLDAGLVPDLAEAHRRLRRAYENTVERAEREVAS